MRTYLLAAIAAAFAIGIGFLAIDVADAAGLSWQAVNATVPTGANTRIDLRLIDAEGRPAAAKAAIVTVRLDMAPSGMPTMTAPIHAVASGGPGSTRFLADIPMAGKWALTVSARVEGQSQPITGTVVIAATDRRSQSAAPQPSASRRILYYRAPMSSDRSAVPKKDPMGMDYIPVYADEAVTVPGAVRIGPERIQRAGVRLETVGWRTLSQAVRAAGTVTHDERRMSIVTSKFSGFVEQLYVGVTGAAVHPGQPLARVWIESNDILAKEADYLIALRGIGDPGDVQRSENNLRLFGVPESMIAELKRTHRPVRTITLVSPRHGIVTQKPAVVGMRFNAGDTLFEVADHSQLWVIAQVPERDLAALNVGETAHVKLGAYPDTPFVGRVSFISPELDMTARTVQVRIEVANPDGRIKIGQYADVTIDARESGGAVVAIPETAIVDSGTRQVVFVAKAGGVFEPRTLTIGRREGGYVEIRRGVVEGERVVTSGNFLIDAESNLQTAISTFTPLANPQ